MAISLGGFSGGGGGGASTDTLDDVTGRGASTTNAITVGGLSVGTAYTMPTADGGSGQAIVSDGAGNLSFTTIDPTGALEYKGSFNATTGQTSAGTNLNNAEQGDYYKIDTAGTIYGQTWAVNDSLIINADMGSVIDNAKIDKIDNTDAPASETVAGVIEIATDLEAQGASATDKALVPSNLSNINVSTFTNDSNYLTSVASASETVAGVIEIATDLEAQGASATDKALVPSNLSNINVSTFTNDSNYLTSVASASETVAGVIEIATDLEAQGASATDKALVPSNLSSIALSTLNDDVSGTGIGKLVKLEDVGGISGLPAVDGSQLINLPSASLFTTTTTALATYDASVNEIINLTANTGGEIRVNLPSSASSGDIIILRKPTNTSSASPAGQATRIAVYNSSGTKLKDLELYPVLGSHILSYDGSDWTFPVTNLSYAQSTSNSYTLYGYRFGHSIIYADNAESTAFTVNIQVAASSLLEGARQRIFTRGERNVIITSTSTDIVDPTGGATNEVLVNTITVPAHAGIIEIWVNSQSQYMINAPLANLGTCAFLDVGTTANKVVQLNSSAQLPALDGSLLTDLNIVEDTSPQLGGNLDVNANEIVSASNNNVTLRPNGIGVIKLGGNTNPAELRFYCETTDQHYVGIKAPTHSELSGKSSISWRLPIEDASTSGDALVSDGNGNLSFTTISGGSAPSVTTDSTGSDTTITTSTGIEEIHLIDNTNNNVTITIPGGTSAGYKYNIKRLGSGTVTIQASSGTIDTAANFSLASQFDSVTLVSDSTNYHII